MPQLQTIEQEHTDLNLHVDLCAQRYASLDTRLTKIEAKIDSFEAILTKNKRSLASIIITSSATILTGIISLIVTILLKF